MNWLFSIFTDRTFGASRSIGWANFRRANIKDRCEFCESRFFLNLHHILPFHLYKELELNKNNVCTLCRNCHFLLGHFQEWASFNKDINEWILLKINKPK